MPPIFSGWLTFRSYCFVVRARRLAVGQVGVEALGHSLPRARLDPLDVEVVDGEAERLHRVGVEQRARVEVVVLRAVVGETVADHQDHAALVAEQPAHGEADQHDHDGQVEEQVAGLAEVPALGRDPALAVDDAVAAVLQHRTRARQHVGGWHVDVVRRVHRQLGQVPRRGGRPGPQRPPVHEQPRDDAADQRDHQQHVDGREPGRVVDREQPEPLVDRREIGVVGLPA